MRLLCFLIIATFALSGCVAGPTPHPSQEEDLGASEQGPDPGVPSAGGAVSESDASSAPSEPDDGAFDGADASPPSADASSDVASDTAADTATDGESDSDGVSMSGDAGPVDTAQDAPGSD